LSSRKVPLALPVLLIAIGSKRIHTGLTTRTIVIVNAMTERPEVHLELDVFLHVSVLALRWLV
jgi:hypothetical protein